MKVVLNPRHFRIRTCPDDGTIWLTHERIGDRVLLATNPKAISSDPAALSQAFAAARDCEEETK